MGLLTVFCLWLWLGRDIGTARSGFFLIGYPLVVNAFRFGGHAWTLAVLGLLVMLAGVALGIHTQGFRMATGRGQIAMFTLAGAGALSTLPILLVLALVALNLALWALIIIAVTALCIAVLAALVSSIGQE